VINLLIELDKKLGQLQNEQEKRELLAMMFKIECRYNLDLLDVIKYDAVNENNDQARTIVKLLSNKALERIITNNLFKDDSFLINTSKLFLNTLNDILDKDLSTALKDNDPLLLKLHKRIFVLQALATIEPPYISLNKINFNVRLKNLHRAILKINTNFFR